MPRTTIDQVGNKYRRFNDWLRGEMRVKRVTQDKLAEYLGCDRRTISRRLTGHIEWSFRDVLEVAEYFEADMSKIL